MKYELEEALEFNIQKMKDNLGYLHPNDFVPYPEITKGIIMENLLGYEFIVKLNPNNQGFTLTGKGWQFESFKKIRENFKLENDLIESNIKASDSTSGTNKFSKRIAIITTLVTCLVTFTQIRTCNRDERKDLLEARKQYQDSIQQLQKEKSDSELNQVLRQISRSLSDTSTRKVKIEK